METEQFSVKSVPEIEEVKIPIEYIIGASLLLAIGVIVIIK